MVKSRRPYVVQDGVAWINWDQWRLLGPPECIAIPIGGLGALEADPDVHGVAFEWCVTADSDDATIVVLPLWAFRERGSADDGGTMWIVPVADFARIDIEGADDPLDGLVAAHGVLLRGDDDGDG